MPELKIKTHCTQLVIDLKKIAYTKVLIITKIKSLISLVKSTGIIMWVWLVRRGIA